MTVCFFNSSPTAVRVSRFTVQRHGSALTFRWHLPKAAGVAGFNVYEGKHRLNGKLIAVTRRHDYVFRTRSNAHGLYGLHVVMTKGPEEVVVLRS